jgi:hypothetical protein
MYDPWDDDDPKDPASLGAQSTNVESQTVNVVDQSTMEFTDARSGRKRTMPSTVPLQSKYSKSLDAIHVIETENAYHILSGNEEIPQMPGLTPIPRPRRVQASPSTPTPGSSNEPKQKRDRVPTITIKWAIHLVRAQLMRAAIAPANYLLKQIYGATVVKISNLRDYNTFLERCVGQKIPFFTHALDSKKPLRIVLLGLPNMPVEDVKQALAENIIFPEDIKLMSIKKSRLLEHNNFILYFSKGSITIGKLREIGRIESVSVKWAYYDSKRHGPTQCRRCQAWGHGSANCHLPAACVKCAGDHETSACPISARGVAVPEGQLKCVNCNLTHSANHRGCPVRQSYIDSRPKKKQPKEFNRLRGGPQHNHQRYTSPRQEPDQWPQMFNMSQNSNKPHHGPSYNQVASKTMNKQNIPSQPNSQNEKPLSPDEAFFIFQEIIPIVNSGKSRQEQIFMIFRLASKYCTSTGAP